MMIEKMTIEQLATLPYNDLVCSLPKDDERWIELLDYFKGMCPNFKRWIKMNNLSFSPENAREYFVSQYKKLCSDKNKVLMAESAAQLEKADFRLGFRLLVSKRLKQYKDNPYKGDLDIGHYVGVKKEAGTDPLTIKNHFLGEIHGVHKDSQGRITSFDLYDEEGNPFTVPAELTYRIY